MLENMPDNWGFVGLHTTNLLRPGLMEDLEFDLELHYQKGDD